MSRDDKLPYVMLFDDGIDLSNELVDTVTGKVQELLYELVSVFTPFDPADTEFDDVYYECDGPDVDNAIHDFIVKYVKYRRGQHDKG